MKINFKLEVRPEPNENPIFEMQYSEEGTAEEHIQVVANITKQICTVAEHVTGPFITQVLAPLVKSADTFSQAFIAMQAAKPAYNPGDSKEAAGMSSMFGMV